MVEKNTDSHIVQRFDRELERVRSDVLAMGGMVEQQLADALRAMEECNAELAEATATNDYKVNRMEVQIDEAVTRILALRQPTASDLRLVLTVSKIIADLERIGDEAERIALFVARITRSGCNRRHYTELQHMGQLVKEMLHRALDAFARMDAKEALQVARMDENIDAEYEANMRQTMTYMMEDPRAIPAFLDAAWCSRALERMGDRSRNICEYVIYLVKGKDVRHITLDQMEELVR